MTSNTESPIVTRAEVAARAGVTVGAVAWAVLDGDLPAPSKIGRVTYWRADQLEQLIQGMARRAARGPKAAGAKAE